MIRNTILTAVLALTGLSVSAPAQVRLGFDFGPSKGVTPRVSAFVSTNGPRIHVRNQDPRSRRGVIRSDRGSRANRGNRGARRVGVRGRRDDGYRGARLGGGSRGYWKTVRQRVWVDGYYENVHVPAEWGYRVDACGRQVRYCIRPAHYERVHRPGCWRYENRRVWVPRRRC